MIKTPPLPLCRRAALASCAVITSLVLLVGCGSSDPAPAPTPAASSTKEQGAVGNAAPEPSPAGSATPVGTTVPFDSVDGAWLLGDTLVWRLGDTVKYLPAMTGATALADPELVARAQVLALPSGCGEFSQSGEELVAGCTEGIAVIAASGELTLTPTERSYLAAITGPDGEFYAAQANSRRVTFLDQQGAEQRSANGPLNTVMFIRTGADIIAFDRQETVVMSVHTATNRGAALRLGVGGGLLTAGPDQTFFATDTLGGQAAVYTSNILRLHQTGVVPASPWALLWDTGRDLLWTASTAVPVATALDPASGSLTTVGELPIIGDARALVSLRDGSLVVMSGGTQPGQLQVIDSATLTAALRS